MRITYLLAVLALLALGGWFWRGAIATHAKVLLLLSEEFPQVPVKPLHALTDPPVHETIRLEAPHGTVVADLFRPGGESGGARPAVVLAMGIKTKPTDRPLILGFADTMSRLGYVVIWPRLEALDQGISLPENPETFVTAHRYLRGSGVAAEDRISMLGFSVGSSTAFVAAADPRISADVRALIFFGGYYDIFEYLVSLATHSSSFGGRQIVWRPDDEAVGHAREVLEATGAEGIARIFSAATPDEAEDVLRSAPEREIEALKTLSPSHHLEGFRARIFILHDTGDRYVPYLESAKLDRALTSRVEKRYLITEAFEHVQPRAGLSWHAVRQLASLYGFMYAAIGYL
jgi:hypothetical protein